MRLKLAVALAPRLAVAHEQRPLTDTQKYAILTHRNKHADEH
jgi:hypothetical protein